MAADADIVLNTALDLTRAGGWVPEPVRVTDAGDGAVEVTWAPQDRARRYALAVRPGERRVEWRPVDHAGWPGELRVIDVGAGASEVELRVEVGEEVPAAEVGEFLERALRGLATEVDQNFNVS
jgi:hypothetical protein